MGVFLICIIRLGKHWNKLDVHGYQIISVNAIKHHFRVILISELDACNSASNSNKSNTLVFRKINTIKRLFKNLSYATVIISLPKIERFGPLDRSVPGAVHASVTKVCFLNSFIKSEHEADYNRSHEIGILL